MLRCVILALAFTTLGAMAHAEDDPAQFMAAVRAKAAAQPAPACPPQPDAAGVVRSSTLPGKGVGEAAGTTGGLSHPLLLVTSTEDTSARNPARGTLRWAVAEARQAGGGWIAFAPGLAGQVIRVASTLRIPSNTTVDGGCGVTLLAPARVTTLLVQDETNVILSGLTFAKEAYDDVEDRTGDAIGLAGHFDQVAILHNAFSRCGERRASGVKSARSIFCPLTSIAREYAGLLCITVKVSGRSSCSASA